MMINVSAAVSAPASARVASGRWWKMYSVESVILACPESFCKEKGFTTSVNDNPNKGEIF